MIRKLFLLLKLGRFPFLFGGFLIFCFGVLLTLPQKLDFFRLFVIYLPIFLAQLSVSYSNDYFDYLTDSKTKRSLISGGSGVLQKNPSLKPIAKNISIALIFASIFLSIVFTTLFQLPLLFILFVCLACVLGWFYSSPPFRFSHTGLGELITFLVVGLLLPLTASFGVFDYFSLNIFLIIPAMFFYSFVFSLSVQLPDYKTDLISHKDNITSKNGINHSVLLIAIFSILSTIYLIILSNFFSYFIYLAIFSFLPLFSSIFCMYVKFRLKKLLVLSSITNVFAIFLFIFLSSIYLIFYLGFI